MAAKNNNNSKRAGKKPSEKTANNCIGAAKPGVNNKSAPADKRSARPAKAAKNNSQAKRGTKQTKTVNDRVEAPYPHFRRYKKNNHPALIVGEQLSDKNKEEYRFRKVMHDERDGRHVNEKVEPNPDPTDPEPMHIARRVRHDEKKRFDKKPLPWKYPPESNKKK